MSVARVDAHQHYWSPAHGDYGWLRDTPELHAIYRDFGTEDLAPLLDDVAIDATVLVQAAPSEAETARLLTIAANPASRVRAVVGWTDLAANDAPRRIRRLAQEPLLRGLRPMLQNLPDPEWILDPRLEPAIRTMTELGLCLDLLIKPHQIDAATKFALRHPFLPMVIDHAAKPDIANGQFEPWASQIATFARSTRVSCKLSGLATEADDDWNAAALRPYVDHLVSHFGPLRLMWGSDWPVLNLAGSYGQWHAASSELLAGLSPLEQEQIMGTNAATFYGIK